jgi:hypothetical protein
MQSGLVTVDGHTERRILACSMRQASGRTRDTSPRKLPTDHDHDGGPQARSANIRVINRRQEPFGRHRPCLEECSDG